MDSIYLTLQKRSVKIGVLIMDKMQEKQALNMMKEFIELHRLPYKVGDIQLAAKRYMFTSEEINSMLALDKEKSYYESIILDEDEQIVVFRPLRVNHYEKNYPDIPLQDIIMVTFCRVLGKTTDSNLHQHYKERYREILLNPFNQKTGIEFVNTIQEMSIAVMERGKKYVPSQLSLVFEKECKLHLQRVSEQGNMLLKEIQEPLQAQHAYMNISDLKVFEMYIHRASAFVVALNKTQAKEIAGANHIDSYRVLNPNDSLIFESGKVITVEDYLRQNKCPHLIGLEWLSFGEHESGMSVSKGSMPPRGNWSTMYYKWDDDTPLHGIVLLPML